MSEKNAEVIINIYIPKASNSEDGETNVKKANVNVFAPVKQNKTKNMRVAFILVKKYVLRMKIAKVIEMIPAIIPIIIL